MKPTVPIVFALCPKCKGRHITLISDLPADAELTDEQAALLEQFAQVHVAELRAMCSQHRRETTVSSYWSDGRPPDNEITRDPRDAPDVMEWRYENCWCADIEILSRHFTFSL
jgi:hypothetical protein